MLRVFKDVDSKKPRLDQSDQREEKVSFFFSFKFLYFSVHRYYFFSFGPFCSKYSPSLFFSLLSSDNSIQQKVNFSLRRDELFKIMSCQNEEWDYFQTIFDDPQFPIVKKSIPKVELTDHMQLTFSSPSTPAPFSRSGRGGIFPNISTLNTLPPSSESSKSKSRRLIRSYMRSPRKDPSLASPKIGLNPTNDTQTEEIHMFAYESQIDPSLSSTPIITPTTSSSFSPMSPSQNFLVQDNGDTSTVTLKDLRFKETNISPYACYVGINSDWADKDDKGYLLSDVLMTDQTTFLLNSPFQSMKKKCEPTLSIDIKTFEPCCSSKERVVSTDHCEMNLQNSSGMDVSQNDIKPETVSLDAWNVRFQICLERLHRLNSSSALEERIDANIELMHLSEDFVHASRTVGKIIISEV
jgi:hypothetical protein